MIISIIFYLMNKYRKQTVQVLTLESFFQASAPHEEVGKKKGMEVMVTEVNSD
jgi:hypothetical protein